MDIKDGRAGSEFHEKYGNFDAILKALATILFLGCGGAD